MQCLRDHTSLFQLAIGYMFSNANRCEINTVTGFGFKFVRIDIIFGKINITMTTINKKSQNQ